MTTPLDWLFAQSAPGATVAILLIAMSLTFLTSLVNRLLTNREQLNAWRREVSAWNAEFKKARKSGDKKLLAKVQKQQPRIMKLQSKMMWQSFKVSLIFMIPFFLLWQLLIGRYGGFSVAYLPGLGEKAIINLPILGSVPSLIWWYMLCSFLFGLIFSRLFGLAMGAPE